MLRCKQTRIMQVPEFTVQLKIVGLVCFARLFKHNITNQIAEISQN